MSTAFPQKSYLLLTNKTVTTFCGTVVIMVQMMFSARKVSFTKNKRMRVHIKDQIGVISRDGYSLLA